MTTKNTTPTTPQNPDKQTGTDAFPEPSGWSLNWDGDALTKMSASSGTGSAAGDVRPTGQRRRP
jgi:hypothetical protein